MSKKMQSFLCSHCKSVMDTDCIQIAEEYQELSEIRKQALISRDHEIEDLKRELADLKRKAATWEQVSKAGLPDIILAWMDKEINTLLRVQP